MSLRDKNIADKPIEVVVSSSANSFEVKYEDGGKAEFPDFHSFLSAVSRYYRKNINNNEDLKEKISLCDDALLELHKYKVGFRRKVHKKELFVDEVQQHESDFTELRQLFVQKSGSTSKEDTSGYSTKQVILILEYLGFNKLLGNLIPTDKAKAEIIAAITGKSYDNILKALRNNIKVVEKGNETKTIANLENVAAFFEKYKQTEIVEKIKEEMRKVK
ncbi:hypothetical protein FE904_18320 [Chryseobacterium indologenes]|uniref:hypothetical protein n=1 Tax=Chryseobacterium indologenes TaxID=253 RepID=UPI00076E320A|nr:hypothetical protein [Chryseobacterium indologenes]TLX24046.1 hypothetical protein FE904_18320 [Chryseobacterium indologenes]